MTEQVESLTEKAADTIQWSVYANYYDAMCSVNPAYEAMLELIENKLTNLQLPSKFFALDIGAGTGNLLCRLASKWPSSEFVHLDIDAAMISRAEEKYQKQNIHNVRTLQVPFLECELPRSSFDLILSTNALYAIHPHTKALERALSLLKPDGKLLLVDFGRKQNTNDWLFYIVRESIKKNGVRATYRIIRDNWEAARQNRRTTAGQGTGQYWLHTTNEFCAELENVGFEVVSADSCYRGYSDLALCRPRLK